MPYQTTATIDGQSYPLSFEKEPTQEDLDYAVGQLTSAHEGQPSEFGSFARSAARGGLPALAGTIGAAAGTAAAEGAELGPIGVIGGGLIGGTAAMLGMGKAQKTLADYISPSASNPFSSASEQKDVETNPLSSMAGDMLIFKPNPANAFQAIRAAGTAEGRQLAAKGYGYLKAMKGMSEAEKLAEFAKPEVKQAVDYLHNASGVAANTGIGAGMAALQGQDPEHILLAAGQGTLFNDSWLHGAEGAHPLDNPKAADAARDLEQVSQTTQDFTQKTAAATQVIQQGLQNPTTTLSAQAAAEKLATKTIPQAHAEGAQELSEAIKPLTETPTTEENAVQEQSPSSLLQHPQEGTREAGSERQRVEQGQQGEETPQAQEKIVAATYADENGTVHEGNNHIEAAGKAGVEAPIFRKDRETYETRQNPQFGEVPEYGFMVEDSNGKRRVVSRREAAEIARNNGQLREGVRPTRGRLHSDDIEMPPQPAQEAPEPQSAPPEQPPPPDAPEPPGTAKEGHSGEFPNPMASKNADVDAAARALGLPERMKGEPVEFKKEFIKQKSIMDGTGGRAGEKLVDELGRTGRTNVTLGEQALLTHEFTRIVNGLESTRAIMHDPNVSELARADARLQNEIWRDRYDKTADVSGKAGTNSSLALLARKFGLKRDHSYEGYLKRARDIYGRAPTEAEEGRVEKFRKPLEESDKQLAESQKRQDEAKAAEATSHTEEGLKEIEKEEKEAKKTGTQKKISKKDILDAVKNAFRKKGSGEISASKPNAADEGLPSVSAEHQNQAVEELKKTEIGRKLLANSIITPDWERVIAHPTFEGREFSTAERELIKRSEGFFDPQTGKSVAIRDNIRPKSGETPQEAVKRVLLHERVGHDGLDALRALDPEFDRKWHEIAAQIPEAEIEALKGRYKDADRETLIREWFAKQIESIDPNTVPNPKTLVGKVWQAIKDFVSRYFGKSTKTDQQVRDLVAAILRSPEALESRRGFGDVMASRPEEEKLTIHDLPHSVIELIARYHIQEGLEKTGSERVHELTAKMRQSLKESGIDATENEVHQAFSRYGEKKVPSKDAAEKELRDLRSQTRVLAALKDVREDQMPKITGTLADKSSPEYRALEKELNEEIRNRGLRKKDESQKSSPLDKKITSLENAIKDTEKQIKDLQEDKDISVPSRPVVKNAETEKLTEKLNDLRKERDARIAERDAQTPITAEEFKRARDRALDRLQKSTKELERRIKEKDFSKKPKKEPVSSKEIEAERLKNAKLRQDYENALYKEQQAQRAPSAKFWDGVVRAKRAFLLTSATVFGKLFAAVHARAFTTTLEELVGHGLHAALPKELTGAAKLEGRSDVTGFAKAYTRAFMRWADDIKSIAKGGKTDIDYEYGPYRGDRDEGWDTMLGKLHYMMKAPAKRAAFEHAFEKLSESARRDGENPADDDVKARIAAGAYQAANRAIFMQDNALVDAFRASLSILDRKGYKGLARLGRVLFPIVKVPTNMIAETLQYAGGIPIGLTKLAKVWHNSFEGLKPEDADLIMRQLKKGSIGTALMTLGFVASGNIGGFYEERQKRKQGDVKPLGVRIAGVDIPGWLMHSPAFQILQMGSTLRRIADEHTQDGGKVGIPMAALAAVWGVISEAPFADEAKRLGTLGSEQGREQYLGDFARAQTVPQIVQQVASATDTGPPRKARNITEGIKLGVPGWREEVPIRVSDGFPPSDKGKLPKAIEDYSLAGGHMPGPPQQAELKKHNPSLTQAKWEKYVEHRGQIVKRLMSEDVGELKTLDSDAQKAAVSAISKEASDEAKRDLDLR